MVRGEEDLAVTLRYEGEKRATLLFFQPEAEAEPVSYTHLYGETVSVDHISFHVDEGETVCIVGESGCGKSVTSLSIMGLLGRGGAVTDGSVLFDGKNLLSLSEKELDEIRGNRMSMIFQDPLTDVYKRQLRG